MTRIALIRHFPTAWNGEARLQGQADIPLTDAARDTLRGLVMPQPWDTARLIASPLSRALETAQILSGGRTVATEPRLVELSWGEWEGRQAHELAADPTVGFRPTHLWGPDDHAPGGESLAQAWARTQPALVDIAKGNAAVLVTHKALMRLILRHAGIADPEIKRGRLYPLTLSLDGTPEAPEPPVRLVPR